MLLVREPQPEGDPMSLTQQLTERHEGARKAIPPDSLAVMDACTQELAESGIVEASLTVGDKAPDFELPNAIGKTVALRDALKNGPAVVSFYRGGW
jgi:hypothetical protein